MMIIKRNSFVLTIISGSILVIVGVAVSRSMHMQSNQKHIEESTVAVATPPVAPETRASTSPEKLPNETREYHSAQYGFSLRYPKELSMKEYDEGNRARTVTFQDASTEHSFEIFVTPYTETQITSARFRMDEPSGVREQPADIMVDQTRAVIFYGKNPIMGDTREVWFIKNGYLYEVATYKSLDTWLANIMQTWRFGK